MVCVWQGWLLLFLSKVIVCRVCQERMRLVGNLILVRVNYINLFTERGHYLMRQERVSWVSWLWSKNYKLFSRLTFLDFF